MYLKYAAFLGPHYIFCPDLDSDPIRDSWLIRNQIHTFYYINAEPDTGLQSLYLIAGVSGPAFLLFMLEFVYLDPEL
jgi:hypothetical protein